MELASLKVVFGMLLKNEDSQMPLFLKIIKCRYFNLVFFSLGRVTTFKFTTELRKVGFLPRRINLGIC